MPVSVTLSSTSFANNGLIPVVHKNSTSCGEANFNPQLSWTVGGDLLPIMVADYTLRVIDTTTGNFIHWLVEGISPSQLSITENGGWLGAPLISPTDWGIGDASNGWNGPCAPNSGNNIYAIQVRAYILPEYRDFLGLNPEDKKPWFDSDIYYFTDNNTNITNEPNTGDCGDPGCAEPGAILIGDLCQLITNVPAVVSDTIYTVTDAGSSTAWGWGGTRFYPDVDNYTTPVRGNIPDGILANNDGAGADLPFTLVNDIANTLWRYDGADATTGRLNPVGIWTQLNAAGMGDDLPINEWIGFSQCIEVPTTKKYCIGLGADNMMRFSLNGNLIARFDASTGLTQYFTHWHVIEVTLNAGTNILTIEGRNSGGPGGFGAEIYDATIPQLTALTTAAALASSGYLFWSSIDTLGLTLDIGEDSGFICPDGTSYNACETGACSSITYSEPIDVECCWLIENCKDENETYLMKLDPAETEIMYNNVVYEFGGPTILLTKCFILKELVVCPEPDLINVTVTTVHGTDNCIVCNPSQQFESCATPNEFEYVSLAAVEGGVSLVVGNIYELSQLEGCYNYVGEVFDEAPIKTEVVIIEDFNTDDCIVCSLCVSFKNCKTDAVINVYLAAGETVPLPDEIVLLSGDPALLDTCWQFISDVFACDPNTIDYTNVVIDLEYGCTDCDTCNPKYLLTDCLDVTNTIEIAWAQSDVPLDESLTYIFDIDSDICWTVSFLPPVPCIEGEELPILQELGTSNILDTYVDCDECNKPCYKLISCDASWPTVATVNAAFAVYVNSTVEWIDNGALTPTKRCATVYEYICRREDYPMPGGGPFPTEPLATEGFTEITILDCFKTCAECEYIEPEPVEPEIETGRKVRPGYTVPDCVTTTKCDDCE